MISNLGFSLVNPKPGRKIKNFGTVWFFNLQLLQWLHFFFITLCLLKGWKSAQEITGWKSAQEIIIIILLLPKKFLCRWNYMVQVCQFGAPEIFIGNICLEYLKVFNICYWCLGHVLSPSLPSPNVSSYLLLYIRLCVCMYTPIL